MFEKLKNAKINKPLHVLFFSFDKFCMIKLILFVCYFSTRSFFRWRSHRSSRLEVFCKKVFHRNFAKFTGKHLFQYGWDRRDSYNKLVYYITVLLNFYISNGFDEIQCKVYLKLSVNIPQPLVLGHAFLSLSQKLIESYKRIRLEMNFP